MNRRLLFLAPILTIAALLYGWFFGDDETPPPRQTNTEKGADFWLEGMDMARLTADGELDYRMTASRESYYADSDVHEFQQPHMAFYRGRKDPWRVDALSGRSENKGKLVKLFGDTKIERGQPGSENWSRIDTRDLRYQTEPKIAESDEFSRISTPDTVTTGTGLRMFLNDERTQLLSNVTSIIDEKNDPTPP